MCVTSDNHVCSACALDLVVLAVPFAIRCAVAHLRQLDFLISTCTSLYLTSYFIGWHFVYSFSSLFVKASSFPHKIVVTKLSLLLCCEEMGAQ